MERQNLAGYTLYALLHGYVYAYDLLEIEMLSAIPFRVFGLL